MVKSLISNEKGGEVMTRLLPNPGTSLSEGTQFPEFAPVLRRQTASYKSRKLLRRMMDNFTESESISYHDGKFSIMDEKEQEIWCKSKLTDMMMISDVRRKLTLERKIRAKQRALDRSPCESIFVAYDEMNKQKKIRVRVSRHDCEKQLTRQLLAVMKLEARIRKKEFKHKRRVEMSTVVEEQSKRFDVNGIMLDLTQLMSSLSEYLTRENLNLFGDVALLLVIFMRCDDTVTRSCAVMKVIFSMTNSKLLDTTLIKVADILASYVGPIFAPNHQSLGEFFGGKAAFLDKLLSTDFISAIRRLFIGITTYLSFPKEQAQKVFDLIGTTSYKMSILMLIREIFTVCSKVVSASALWFYGDALGRAVPISDIFFGADRGTNLFLIYTDLKLNKENLYSGLPVVGRMHITVFARKARAYINEASSYADMLGYHNPATVPLKMQVNDVQSWLNSLASRINKEYRVPTFTVLITGTPGCGKSLTVPLFAARPSKIRGDTFDPSQVHYQNPNAEHWEEYEPLEHNVCFMSEAAKMTKKRAETKGDPTMDLILSLSDSNPYSLPMAFERKGKTYFMCEIFLLDANNPGLNLEVLYSAVSAVWRRLFGIEQHIVAAYRQGRGSVMVDSEKVQAGIDSGAIKNELEVIRFNFFRHVPLTNTTYLKVQVGPSNMDVYKAVEVFDAVYIDHVMRNSKLTRKTKEFANMIECIVPMPSLPSSFLTNNRDTPDESQGFIVGNPIKINDGMTGQKRFTLACDSVSHMLSTVLTKVSAVTLVKSDNPFAMTEMFDFKIESNIDNPEEYCLAKLLDNKIHGYSYDSDVMKCQALIQDQRVQWNSLDEVEFKTYTLTEIERQQFYDGVDRVGLLTSHLTNGLLDESSMSFCEDVFQKILDYEVHVQPIKRVRDQMEVEKKDNEVLKIDLSYTSVVDCVRAIIENFLKFVIARCINNFVPEINLYVQVLIFLLFFVFLSQCFSFGFINFIMYIYVIIWMGLRGQYQIMKKVPTSYLAKCEDAYLRLRGIQKESQYAIVRTSKNYMIYAAAIAIGVALTYKAVKVFLDTFLKKVIPNVSEERVTFKVTPVLEQLEARDGSSVARPRIKTTQDPFNWNVVHNVPTGVFTQSREEFVRRINGYVFYSWTWDPRGQSRLSSYVFIVAPEVAMINTHYHKEARDRNMEVRFSLEGMVTDKYVMLSTSKYVDLGNDITLAYCPRLAKDTVKHICAIPPKTGTGYINRDVVAFSYVSANLYNSEGKHITDEYYMYDGYEAKGLCGNVICAQVGMSWVVCGFHAAGLDGIGYAVPFYRSKIETGVTRLRAMVNLVPLNAVPVQNFAVERLGEVRVSSKSPFFHVPLHGIDFHGTYGKALVNMKSEVVPNVLTPVVPCIEYAIGVVCSKEYAAPCMRAHWQGEGDSKEYVSPQNNALSHFSKCDVVYDEDILSEVTDFLVTTLYDRALTERKDIVLEPYNIDESVNGARDDQYFKRINASTAAGHGFPGKKEAYLPVLTEIPFKRGISVEVSHRMGEIITHWSNDECSGAISNVSLKDEPVSRQKAKAGVTRLFYCQDLASLILHRKYLGPFVTLMQELNAFFCAVGINMYTNADKIFSKFCKFSNYTEVDAEKFDIKAQLIIMRVRATIIYRLCEKFGYNEYALKMLNGVLSDLCCPMMFMNGDLFSKPIIISGHYGTAQLNCLFLLIMLCYIFIKAKKEGKVPKNVEFYEHLDAAFFGDDQGISVSDKLRHVVNNFAIKDAFARFHMSITASDKSSDLEKFVRIENATFLKRSFRMSKYFSRVVAPLEPNSIYKMCSYSIYGKSCTPLSHDISVVNSALPEIVLHIIDKEQGPDLFESIRSRMIDVLFGVYGRFSVEAIFSFEKCVEILRC